MSKTKIQMTKTLRLFFLGFILFLTMLLTFTIFLVLFIPLWIRYKLEKNQYIRMQKHPVKFLSASFRLFDKTFGKFF